MSSDQAFICLMVCAIGAVITAASCILSEVIRRSNKKWVEETKKLRDKPGYHKMGELSGVCWVRALDRLNFLKNDPNVTGVAMIYGMLNGGGHAWIEYKRGNEVIQYDPTTEKVVKIEEKL